ncbi:MAG: hypothetical protein KAS12_01440 [Candidatus Aenigmarchaeota archaeon]|nr:hypothetical protein [Candidatus Aenigmarchaeota archaeon]
MSTLDIITEKSPLNEGIIDYSDIRVKCPWRSNFLDQKQTENMNKMIKESKPMLFKPNDVQEHNVQVIKYQPYEYQLYIFGILLDGSKTLIIVNGIKLYFYVKVPNKNLNGFQITLENILDNAGINFTSITDVQAMPDKGFQEHPSNYKKITFPGMKTYKNALKLLNVEFTTANDDLSSYYRKVAREGNFSLSNWNKITKYQIVENIEIPSKCAHVLRVNIRNITEIKDGIKELDKDKMVIMCWDIETYTPRGGELPMPEHACDRLEVICMTFHWTHSAQPFLKVAISKYDSAPVDDVLIIKCDTEAKMIRAWCEVFEHILPEFWTGFNDGLYDMPWMFSRAKKHKLLPFMKEKLDAASYRQDTTDENIERWVYKKERIKITPETNAEIFIFKPIGSIPFDTRVIYQKLYPKDNKSSLNYYLTKCHIELKADMPYKKMSDIFKNPDLDGMHDIIYYCVIDSQRCQELLVHSNVIDDAREMACISYTSIYDSIFRANGLRVRNCMMYHGFRKNIVYSVSLPNMDRPKEKPPGGYVFPPIKGLNNDMPVVGLDFASLYPSLIRTYNISFEKLIKDEAFAEELKAKGYDLYYMEFIFNNERLRGWTVRHGMDREKMGVIPLILEDLFNARNDLKAVMNPTFNLLENIDKYGSKEKVFENYNSPDFMSKLKPAGKEILDEIICEEFTFSDIKLKLKFVFNKYNTKQKAVKVYMNTFYGVMGTPGPLYDPMIVAFVTLSGQYNTKKSQKFVESQGCKVNYGDTDSIYTEPPKKIFDDITEEFNAGQITKEAYWTKKVQLTKIYMDGLLKDLNAELKRDNGCPYLFLNYEEVLFPYILCGKKKYCGIAHINDISFKTDKPFVRGLEYIKQSASKLLIVNSERIIKEALSIDNIKPLCQIVEECLDGIFNTVWPTEFFVGNATFRPQKNNVPVQKFVRRMKEAEKTDPTCIAPGSGEKFSYVVVKKEQEYTVSGKKIPLQKGDKMEYQHIAERNNMVIDINHYVNGSIIGAFARFICYRKDFLFATDPETGAIKQLDDDVNVKLARKYITGLVKLKNSTENLAEKGRRYRSIYRIASKEKNTKFVEKFGVEKNLFSLDPTAHLTKEFLTIHLTDNGKCTTLAKAFIYKYTTRYDSNALMRNYTQSKKRDSFAKHKGDAMHRMINSAFIQLSDIYERIKNTVIDFDNVFDAWIIQKRDNIDEIFEFDNAHSEDFIKFRKLIENYKKLIRYFDYFTEITKIISARKEPTDTLYPLKPKGLKINPFLEKR